MTERAIATLYAMTGATDRQGGNIWTVAPPARIVSDYGLLDRVQQKKGARPGRTAPRTAVSRLDHRAGFLPRSP